MEYQEILYDVADAIATITFNRPQKLNASTMRMAAETRHAFGRADKDSAVRVIIVTGAGKGYCAGATFRSRNPMLPCRRRFGAPTLIHLACKSR
jgi:enoyl-CoA hydratase/carnithine racemase